MSIEHAVHRLTGELADWYRLDAGHLQIGDRADVVVDPEWLDSSLDGYAEDVVDQRTGRFLRAAHLAPAVTRQEGAWAHAG